jgi:hypothetical protein
MNETAADMKQKLGERMRAGTTGLAMSTRASPRSPALHNRELETVTQRPTI